MKMIDDKNIGDVQVENSQIVFTDKDHKTIYKTGTMEDPGLTERLYNSGATFAKDIEQTMSPLMSAFKRRIAIFLCMVMTLTTVFCMMPQQEVQAAKINKKSSGTFYMGISTVTLNGVQYITNPICAHGSAIMSAVSEYSYSVANLLSTRSSKMFKINSVTGKGTTATITLKSKVTADQLFGLACTTRKDYKSTIKKGNTCQFKIKLKGNGKTISATATAKVGSNKITIKTKKLTKGKTYVLQDCYYGGWLDSKKGGNKKISFKAK